MSCSQLLEGWCQLVLGRLRGEIGVLRGKDEERKGQREGDSSEEENRQIKGK